MVGRAAALLTPRFVAGLALLGALLAYYAFFRELPNLPTTADVLWIHVAGTLKVLELLTGSTELRDRLAANTRYFREGLARAGVKLLPEEHPIVPIMFGDAVLAARFAEAMLEHGVYVIAFSYPVVPQGQARIRTQMSAAHTTADLDRAIEAFGAVKRQFEADSNRNTNP